MSRNIKCLSKELDSEKRAFCIVEDELNKIGKYELKSISPLDITKGKFGCTFNLKNGNSGKYVVGEGILFD